MILTLIGLFTFLINIPFGYWRSRTKKFSFNWFLAVHAPVPIIYALRISAGIEWDLFTFPVLIGCFFLGQLVGGRFLKSAMQVE